MARVTLFCLPYAGAGAAVYRDWQGRLPDWIKLVPLHLPGRGVRYGQPAISQWPALMDLLISDMRPHLASPFAIFGHSMGALVGYELAHTLRDRLQRQPVWLGASACTAPSRRDLELKWLSCPEDELIEELESLQGTPLELLENRELMDLVLPVVRADFHLCGSYRPERRPALTCPMLVLGGTEDELSQEPLNLQAWSKETSAAFRLEMFDGDHFFINSHRNAVLDLVARSLSAVVPHAAPIDA